MSKADVMFEKLGYEKWIDKRNIIHFIHNQKEKDFTFMNNNCYSIKRVTKAEQEAIKSMKRFVECRQDMTAVTASEMKVILDLIQNIEDNYVSKEKIKNKIKELENEGYWEFYETVDLNTTIQILKKLLEEK